MIQIITKKFFKDIVGNIIETLMETLDFDKTDVINEGN